MTHGKSGRFFFVAQGSLLKRFLFWDHLHFVLVSEKTVQGGPGMNYPLRNGYISHQTGSLENHRLKSTGWEGISLFPGG